MAVRPTQRAPHAEGLPDLERGDGDADGAEKVAHADRIVVADLHHKRLRKIGRYIECEALVPLRMQRIPLGLRLELLHGLRHLAVGWPLDARHAARVARRQHVDVAEVDRADDLEFEDVPREETKRKETCEKEKQAESSFRSRPSICAVQGTGGSV
jgi:hypothetical protein